MGRRQVFALTLLVYGLATGASALSWSVGALLATRFVVGLGLGAELPVASTLVSEFAPARIRGRVVVVLEAFWAVGWLLAALIGFLVIPVSDDGWRWALALGAVPAVYSVVVRRTLPESVRFLESVGRDDEAEATVRRFEASAGITPDASAATAAQPVGRTSEVATKHAPTSVPPTGIWSPSLRRRTASLWIVWFGVSFAYYGAFIWLPSLLHASGFSLVRSFGYTLVITAAQLPGYAVAAVLIERWGRRPTLGTFLVGSAASAVAFGTADSTAAILGAGMALSFFNLGAWGALYAVTPEIYPTSIRGRGAGSAAAFGRLASIIAPLCVPLLRDAGGTPTVFLAFAAAFGVAALGVLGVPDLRGRPLDE